MPYLTLRHRTYSLGPRMFRIYKEILTRICEDDLVSFEYIQLPREECSSKKIGHTDQDLKGEASRSHVTNAGEVPADFD